MAIQVIEDIVAGAEYSKDNKWNKTFKRVFDVFGLNISTRVLEDACNALPTNAQVNGWHPTITNLMCHNVYARHFNPSAKQAQVVAEYATYVPDTQTTPWILDVKINGTTIMQKSNVDNANKLMRVPFCDTTAAVSGLLTNLQTAKDSGQFTVAGPPAQTFLVEPVETDRPIFAPTLEFSYTEWGNPCQKQKTYMNCTNSLPWQGMPKGYWLCRNIDAQTQLIQGNVPNGLWRWNVNYMFQGNPKGWANLKVFRNSITGKTPINVEEPTNGIGADMLNPTRLIGNGWALFNDFGSADFNALNLLSLVTH